MNIIPPHQPAYQITLTCVCEMRTIGESVMMMMGRPAAAAAAPRANHTVSEIYIQYYYYIYYMERARHFNLNYN
jgi:hypothetical protein